MADRKTILGRRPVPVYFNMPEWGGRLRADALTALEADRFRQTVLSPQLVESDNPNVKAKALWVVRCLQRPDKTYLFTEPGDADALLDVPRGELEYAFAAVSRANGLDRELEEMEGNSESESGSDSPSGSPAS